MLLRLPALEPAEPPPPRPVASNRMLRRQAPPRQLWLRRAKASLLLLSWA